VRVSADELDVSRASLARARALNPLCEPAITATAGRLTPYRGRVPAPPETDFARIRKYCLTRVPARLRDQARIEANAGGGR
jgi:hypothetical protein